MVDLTRREVNLGLLALLARTGLELPVETAEAPSVETTQPIRDEISYGHLAEMYRKIKEIERRFARREETEKDIGDYFACKGNIYINMAVLADKDKRFARKGINAFRAVWAYYPHRLVCT